MQQWFAIVRQTHLRYLLPFGDLLALLGQQLPVVPVGTQEFIIVFDDNKPAVPDQSTPAVHNLSPLSGAHRITGFAGQFNALA